ncbi:hypothetical protein M569_07414, partial [Genlisea aurea]
MAAPRLLRGHRGSASCCIASRFSPGIVATADEDGCVCLYDLRCGDAVLSIDVGKGRPVSSLCFKPGKEDFVFISTGNEVKCFHMHMAASYKELHSFVFNEDEINQVVHHPKSSFIAAADDSGGVKIIDVHQKCLNKTLRAGHENICSSVQFIPWRPWEAITGGFDSKLVMWDFSRGRPNKFLNFGIGADSGQVFNPPFLHALAVPDLDIADQVGKVCAVARGDGVVSIIDIEAELAAGKTEPSKIKRNNSKSTVKTSPPVDRRVTNLDLDYSMGGHTSSVSSVAFSSFGEKGKLVVSGGNDKSVKVWDWNRAYDSGRSSIADNILRLDIGLQRKVNWICTTPCDSENLVVCDTSKTVKVYTV